MFIKEPMSEHARYAFGYSDKKPSWRWWLINGLIIAYVLYNAVSIQWIT